MNHFVEAILDSRPVLTPGEAGLQAMMLAEYANRAARAGEVQTLSDCAAWSAARTEVE